MGIFDEMWHSTCLFKQKIQDRHRCAAPQLGVDPLFSHKGLVINPWMIWLWDDQRITTLWKHIVRRTARISCWLVVCYSVNIWSNMFSLCLIFFTNMHNYVSAFWICTTNGSNFPAMFCIHILNTHKTHLKKHWSTLWNIE